LARADSPRNASLARASSPRNITTTDLEQLALKRIHEQRTATKHQEVTAA
jgi:hypothetical protein